jgi:hypothetical protein
MGTCDRIDARKLPIADIPAIAGPNHGGWTKSPDEPLADYLQLQARRRSWRDLAPNRTTVDEPNGD